VVADVADEPQRGGCAVVERSAELLGVLLQDGEFRVDLGQALIAEIVDAGEVWRDVAVGLFDVREEGLGVVVALVGELQRLGAVLVVLEGGDGVEDDGVGGEVL
jgi:hypothetical protein